MNIDYAVQEPNELGNGKYYSPVGIIFKNEEGYMIDATVRLTTETDGIDVNVSVVEQERLALKHFNEHFGLNFVDDKLSTNANDSNK